MRNDSIDNNNWAQLAEQIELASAARLSTDQVKAEAKPVPVTGAKAGRTSSIDEIDIAELLPNNTLFGTADTADRTKSGVRSHLAWGVGGFFLGAVCWYFIGFWAFVGSLLFSGPENVTSVQRNIDTPVRPRVLSYVKKRPTTPTVQSSYRCTAFYRDPATGFAVPSKCQTIVRALGGTKPAER